MTTIEIRALLDEKSTTAAALIDALNTTRTDAAKDAATKAVAEMNKARAALWCAERADLYGDTPERRADFFREYLRDWWLEGHTLHLDSDTDTYSAEAKPIRVNFSTLDRLPNHAKLSNSGLWYEALGAIVYCVERRAAEKDDSDEVRALLSNIPARVRDTFDKLQKNHADTFGTFNEPRTSNTAIQAQLNAVSQMIFPDGFRILFDGKSARAFIAAALAWKPSTKNAAPTFFAAANGKAEKLFFELAAAIENKWSITINGGARKGQSVEEEPVKVEAVKPAPAAKSAPVEKPAEKPAKPAKPAKAAKAKPAAKSAPAA